MPGQKVRIPPGARHPAGDHVPVQVDPRTDQRVDRAGSHARGQSQVQRGDSDDRSASESPKSETGSSSRGHVTEHSPTAASRTAAGPMPIPSAGRVMPGALPGNLAGSPLGNSPAGRKAQQKAKMVYMPRPFPYQPYYAYPHYYMPPEDPRYMGMPLNMQPPYLYNYGGFPQRPPNMGMPVPFHMQPRPTGSGSLSPASSSDGSMARPPGPLEISPTDSSQSDNRPYSPALSPGSNVTGIQVLPNVKHVPSHLFNTPGSGPNSRSSTPAAQSSSPLTVTLQKKEETSEGSVSVPQVEKEFPTFRKRQHSGPRPVSQSPSYSSQSSHESSMSPTHEAEGGIKTEMQFKMEMSNQMTEKTSSLQTRVPKNLKLNTTGFSRQFSDDLGTPTEVTKLVKMIEENIDEEDEDFASKADALFHEQTQMMKPSPPSGKLYLNLKAPPHSEETVSHSSSGSSIDDDVRRSYAGGVRPAMSYKDQELPILEPQTPMTPAGFITPGTDMNTDPLELLKNLNINNDNLNRSTHGHFY